jgi:hypothetical protein
VIIGLTGHQDLPPAVVRYTREKLRDIGSQAELVGVCSLAVGADQLFAEAVLASGGALWVVVPSRGYESTFDKQADLERFRELLGRAEKVEELTFSEPSETAYFAAGRRIVELCDKLVAVWDGKKARGLGGTGDVVAYANQKGKPVEVLWVQGVSRK